MKRTNPYLVVFCLLGLFQESRAWICSPRVSHLAMKGLGPTSTKTPLMSPNRNRQPPNGRLRGSTIPLTSSRNCSRKEDSGSKIKSKIFSFIKFFKNLFRRLLWPGLNKNFDPNLGAPLPEIASLGCPFFGNNILAGSKNNGPEKFYSEASAKLDHPSIWRFYFLGAPVTSVSGSKNVNTVFKSKNFDTMSLDFSSKKTDTKVEKEELFSSKSVMFENDRKKHVFLRRLMGAAFTPSAINDGTQKIEKAVMDQLHKLKDGEIIEMEDICEDFTLDIAWRTILGLDLKDGDEIQRFRKAVDIYTSGLFGVELYLNFPGKHLLPTFKARRYLVSKIIERVAYLEENGPDGSTLSAMVFASDEDSNKKLTREEIVENSLILLVAGTETTAATLTSAMFLLGLHPRIFEKIVQEQRELVSTNGATITGEVLANCTYLDAVIHETMRISPVSGGNLRIAKEAMVLDGKQVPKGGAVFANIRLTHELDPKITSSESLDPLHSFAPERWLDTETKPTEDFFPFGAGNRRCLGAPLAMAEMRIFLSLLARRIDSFELLGEGSDKTKAIRWNPSSLMRKPLGGVPIRTVATNASVNT